MAKKKIPNYEDLKFRFEQEVQRGLQNVQTSQDLNGSSSADYQEFRKSFLATHHTLYEQACNFCEKIIKIPPDKKRRAKMEKDLDTAHIQATPEGVMSFALFGPLFIMFVCAALSMILTNSMFLVFFFLILGGLGMLLLVSLPNYFANNWRMKGSNEMILAVFYIVTYMRHTSNLERAIEFAASHLQPPMSLDLKKILWNVETEQYSTIEASVEAYLENWRGYNDEFIEAMHLIEGSLLEESEQHRLDDLNKALDVILQQTYEKMLHYAHNLQSPITTLHMLGIILPILGLVILPLIVSFIAESRWYHIAAIYNVALPICVFVLGKNILSKRPTGYGATEIDVDTQQKNKNTKIWILSFAIFAVCIIIAFSPIWLKLIGIPDFGFGEDVDPDISVCAKTFCFFDYKLVQDPSSPLVGQERGPYGLGAALIGLFAPLAFCIAMGLYFTFITGNSIKVREKTKELEKEFSHAIFTLGNRLGDGIPAEMAFNKVAESLPGTTSGRFCMLVSYNIEKLGMSVEQAIFDAKHGAIRSFPSNLIESSMKVLIQSVKKGPTVASQTMMNISRYLDEVHRVNERLQDLMGEVITSMKSQINFLMPIISGIVIGITSMISMILSRLSGTIGKLTQETSAAGTGLGAGGGLLDIFSDGVPTYFFQIIVGLYVVQLVYVLTVLVNGIENGVDDVNQKYLLGKNMLKSVGLYIGIALSVMIIFNFIAASILGGLNT